MQFVHEAGNAKGFRFDRAYCGTPCLDTWIVIGIAGQYFRNRTADAGRRAGRDQVPQVNVQHEM
jgi:hypothetical protein